MLLQITNTVVKIDSKEVIIMALWLFRDESRKFYCKNSKEKSKTISSTYNRKIKNYKEKFSFIIIRDLFIFNCEFEFEI